MDEYSFTPVRMSIPETKNSKYHRILEAAVKVFARKGFGAATVAEVAREAGVADGTIYLYFKSKDDILVHFFTFKAQQVFDRFHAAVARGPDAVAKLRHLVRAHLSEFQKDPDMALLYMVETHQGRRAAEDQIRTMSKAYQDILSEILEQGQQEGLIRRDLYVSLVRRFIVGAVEETIDTWLHSGHGYDLASMADPLVDLIVRGIGAETDANAAAVKTEPGKTRQLEKGKTTWPR
jgi:TetR/AcrR family fatty acid metabolism transcriptional regulator